MLNREGYSIIAERNEKYVSNLAEEKTTVNK